MDLGHAGFHLVGIGQGSVLVFHDVHLEVAHPIIFLEAFAEIQVVRGQDEIDVFKLVEVFQKGVSCLRGLGGISARVELVENAEMATGIRRCRVDGVQNVFATSAFGLEERVAFRRVGDIEVRMNVGIRVQDTLGIKSAADLLTKDDVDGRGFQKGGFAASIRSGDDHILVQTAIVLNARRRRRRHRVFGTSLLGYQQRVDLSVDARGRAPLCKLGGTHGPGRQVAAYTAQIVEVALEAKAVQ